MRCALTVGKLGSALATGSSSEFGSFMAAQTAKWSAVAKKANIKVE